MLKPSRPGEDAFIELTFSFSEAGNGRYDLRVEMTDEGSVTVNFETPLSVMDSEDALALIPNSLDVFQRSSAQTSPRDSMKKLGEALFNSMLEGRARSLYEHALRAALSRGKALRIRLDLPLTEIASLPWEFLYDPARADFFALSVTSPLVRSRMSSLRWSTPVKQPVRILIANSELLANESKAEYELLEGLSNKYTGIELIHLKNTKVADLMSTIEEDCFHIVHVVANGRAVLRPSDRSAPSYQSSSLRFGTNRPGDLSDPLLGAKDLGLLVGKMKALKLVCLSGDYTDQVAADVATFCPSVIGWRGANTEGGYLSFTEGLYTSLLSGSPLEVAVTQGRQKIDLDHPGGKEWGMPVCYLQEPHGAFFSTPRKTAREARTVEEQQLPVKDGTNPRHWQKLHALLEIERRNLEAIEEESAAYVEVVPMIIQEQRKTTADKISNLEAKIKDLA